MRSIQQTWNAGDYAKNSSAQLQWAQELISKLTLQGYESVLDIGCGDGKISAQLALILENGNVVGIDLSEEMICLAKTKFPLDKYLNLSFLRMDATDIRLTCRFDVAFSNATLHWVRDHLAVLRGARACLKAGGKILMQMGGRGNAAEIFDAIEMAIQSPQWTPYYGNFSPPYYFYGPEEYQEWLSASGFRVVRIELISKDMQHQGVSRPMLSNSALQPTPVTRVLPVSLHEIPSLAR